MHFLMNFLLIQDYFIIVIWQKYLLLRGLRNDFLFTEVPFLAYPIFLKITVFNAISKSGVGPKKGVLSTKIHF